MRRPRSRSSDDSDAVDVLIVDDDDDEDVAADEVRSVLHQLALESMAWRATWPGEPNRLAEPAAVVAPEPPTLAGRVAMRYRRRAVVAAVLAVAVAATTAVMDARQSAARAAALAALPAVLAQVASAPAEVWRVPGRVVTSLDDVLLVADRGSLRGIDPASGEASWTASAAAGREASTGDCFAVDEALMPGRAPVADGSGPRGLVACVPGAPDAPDAADAADASRDAGDAGDATNGVAGIVVVDSTTGRTRHTVTTGGAVLLAEPAGRDLLVAAALADGRVRVARWDLATGAPRWDVVSPQPAPAGAAVERRPGSLTVGGFAVDLTTGRVLDAALEGAQPYPYVEHALPDGGRATWAWYEDGTSGQGRVSGGTEGSWYSLPGPPLRPPVTDGSDDGVLVVPTARGDRLRGLDLRTGRMTWTQRYLGASALRATALVRGVMLLDDGATVTALEVATGRRLWSAPLAAGVTGGAALTDGQVVLLPVLAEDGVLHLAEHRLADGTVARRTEAPAGTVSLRVVGHRLIASTPDDVVGLG